MSTTTTNSPNSPLKTISAALNLVETKKERLKKAFEDLQSIYSVPLHWSDLDLHFGHAQTSLTARFHRLESLESLEPVPEPSKGPVVELVRPELKDFCSKMDGKGLRRYIGDLSTQRSQIKIELTDAMGHAPDPAVLVLDAVEGFYVRVKGGWDSESGARRGVCELLLETLMGLSHGVGVEVKERAKKLAFEWKGKVSADEDLMSITMGFLLLAGAYDLGSEFDVNELLDYLVRVSARHRQTIELIRALGLLNEVTDLIQKLMSKGKHLLAVKFIIEFNLTDKFPPVALLKTHIEETMEAAKKLRIEGSSSNCLRSLNQAISKEIGALRSVIKIIEEHKLECEELKCNLEKQLEQLQRDKANGKRSTNAASAAKPQKQNGSKRSRTNAFVGPGAVPVNVGRTNSTVSSFYQPHLLPEHPAPYLSSASGPYATPSAATYPGSSAGSYGVVGSTPTAMSYAAGPYGAGGGPIGLPGNPSLAGSQLYSSDPHMISSYSERPTTYGTYGMPPQYQPPQYQPPYYP